MISFEQSGDVALVVMDDGKANAVNDEFIGQLSHALDRAESESSALVIAGRERVFSGGFDLNVLSRDEATAAALLDAGGALALRLLRFPLPVVTVATGHAIAMGLLMFLAGDVRITEPGDQRLQMNETINEMVLPDFAVEILRARLAPSDVATVGALATPMSAEMAVACGVATEMADVGGAYEVALSKATDLAELPTAAFAAQKRLLLDSILS